MGFTGLSAMLASATARPFAAPELTSAGGTVGVGNVTEVVLSLALVLAAIFAFAAIARRLRGVSRSGGVVIRVISEVQLGPKERAVLLEAGGTRLLVGVAPGRVSTLHVLPASAVIEEGAAAAAAPGAPAAGFRDLLQRLMVPR